VAEPIRVNLDELDRLAQTLRRVQNQLGSLAQDFGRFDAAIGAPTVKSKLQEVAGNWSKARQRVNGEIGRLAEMAELASATYKDREQMISRAASRPVEA
jgi:DNA anti-recombination protein RmuC